VVGKKKVRIARAVETTDEDLADADGADDADVIASGSTSESKGQRVVGILVDNNHLEAVLAALKQQQSK
jgi:hypothetical protein